MEAGTGEPAGNQSPRKRRAFAVNSQTSEALRGESEFNSRQAAPAFLSEVKGVPARTAKAMNSSSWGACPKQMISCTESFSSSSARRLGSAVGFKASVVRQLLGIDVQGFANDLPGLHGAQIGAGEQNSRLDAQLAQAEGRFAGAFDTLGRQESAGPSSGQSGSSRSMAMPWRTR